MSKKHFESLAAVFKEQQSVLNTSEYFNAEERSAALRVLESTARTVAAVCADANPRFDTRRFLAACGIN
jgi:hypothetical protein